MRIVVKAKPSAREEQVERIDEQTLKVSVTEPPVDGRANEAILHALAAHFGVARSAVRIISGHTSRNKIIEIL